MEVVSNSENRPQVISKEQLLSLCQQGRAILVGFERISAFAEGTHIPVMYIVVVDSETGMKYEYWE
jgi:hypothetical protein